MTDSANDKPAASKSNRKRFWIKALIWIVVLGAASVYLQLRGPVTINGIDLGVPTSDPAIKKSTP